MNMAELSNLRSCLNYGNKLWVYLCSILFLVVGWLSISMANLRFTRLAIMILAISAVQVTHSYSAPIRVLYVDSANEGFYDPVLGASRRAAFEYAAAMWVDVLSGDVPIEIEVSMDPMGGSGTAAVLGSAGPSVIVKDTQGIPLSNVWYTIALANQFAGLDLSSSPDLRTRFNSDIDGDIVLGDRRWYYGIDRNPGNDFDFVSVVMHEICHGLGFLSLIRGGTGEWLNDIPDVYGLKLLHEGVGMLVDLTDAQRLTALTSDSLFWTGQRVVAMHGAIAQVYAPGSYRSGSSISHWDRSHTPNELMEPYYMGPNHSSGLALFALQDMGWGMVGNGDELSPPLDVEIEFESQ
jgi:hypothetical protein